MITAHSALLALYAPSLQTLLIAFFAATLPVCFFFALNWWLSSVKDENPEEFERAQAKADQEHAAHRGHGKAHGHEHGVGHSHGKGHAHG